VSRLASRIEDAVAAAALAVMAVIPLLEIILRRAVGIGIPGAGPIVQHLVLWVGFLAPLLRPAKAGCCRSQREHSCRPGARDRWLRWWPR
jgi:hypothetical protein